MSIYFLSILLIVLPTIATIYQSKIILSTAGTEFQPKMNAQELSNIATVTVGQCSSWCNQLAACRTFDYDSVSRRCRLFEGDTMTGSVVASTSAASVVGTVLISASLYTDSHAQSCLKCQQTRYEMCSTNTSSCQCPAHTYWNGFICALQLFSNDICTHIDACRSDLNLTCSFDCYGEYQLCLTPLSNSKFYHCFGTLNCARSHTCC
jgi:hypothetical protein